MTTIVSVRRNGVVAVGGDGQVTMGQSTILKGNARKVRKIFHDKVIAGFAGSTADAFTLLDLFEKKLNPHLKSEIAIDLGSETIIINYKSDELQFNDSSMSGILNNPYVYMGLQKALYRFIIKYGEDDQVYLDDIEYPEDGLDFKLYNLMKSKMITELNTENIDEVISKISDKILNKFTSAVRGLYKNED